MNGMERTLSVVLSGKGREKEYLLAYRKDWLPVVPLGCKLLS